MGIGKRNTDCKKEGCIMESEVRTKRRISLKARETAAGYLFLLPNIIGFIAFSLIPVITAFFLSMTNWNGMQKTKFIGLKNFMDLFHHESFLIALKNTFVYAVTFVPLTLAVALAVAILLNQKLKAVKVYRAVFFMPYISSAVAISYVWAALLNPTSGPINMFLKTMGMENPPMWLTSTQWAMATVVLISVWKNFGYYSIIYLASLQGVPKHLEEAAKIDGANRWQVFRHITVPELAPVTFFCLIMAAIGSFKVFDQVYVMTEGGPGQATTTLVQYIYTNSFQNYRMGYGSAAAVVLFAIIFIVTLIQYRGQRKWND